MATAMQREEQEVFAINQAHFWKTFKKKNQSTSKILKS